MVAVTASLDDVQEALGRGTDSWSPREGEDWASFVRRKAPAQPSFMHPFDRADFGRALEAALRRGELRETTRALVIPIWFANNEDEVARDDEWRASTVVVAEADDALLVDAHAYKESRVWARAEITLVKGSFVTLARGYAPEIGTRFGKFAVVESTLRVIASSVVDGDRIVLTPKPTRMVPAFSMHYEPAFDLATVPPDFAAAATRVTAALSFDGDS